MILYFVSTELLATSNLEKMLQPTGINSNVSIQAQDNAPKQKFVVCAALIEAAL